jgi:ribonuclease HI
VKDVAVYTDGACSGNPGPGGWSAILTFAGRERELSGGAPETTNNRMELMAVIAALEELNQPCRVTVFSDSRYVVDSFEKNWIAKWKRNNWMKTKSDPVPNADLWQRLLAAVARHQVTWKWVRGHDGHLYNERCDELAVAAADAQKKKV